MEGFRSEVRVEGRTAVIDMQGLLDRSADTELGRAIDAALELSVSQIALNFTEVEYINSTGIALVVGALARARAVGRAVHAFGLTDHYREIFTITRLSDFIGIYDDESAALAD